MSTLNERGHEVFSGERRALPIHIGKRSPSIHERIRSMILAMKSAEREGYETFEDADDFDVGDDSPDKIEQLPNYQRYEYEKDFDHFVDTGNDDGKKIVYRNTRCEDLYAIDNFGQAPRNDRQILVPAAQEVPCNACTQVEKVSCDSCSKAQPVLKRRYIIVPAM